MSSEAGELWCSFSSFPICYLFAMSQVEKKICLANFVIYTKVALGNITLLKTKLNLFVILKNKG